MNLIDTLDTAVRGLRSYKLRSLLTMLGLVIGVGAVIVMSALGRGVDNSVSAAIEPIANSITVTPQIAPMPGSPPSKPLTDSDERAIAQLPGVSDVVPTVTGSNTQAAGQVSKAVTASTRDAHYLSATVIGTSADYLSTSQKTVHVGQFFTEGQDRAAASVAVIGPSVAQALYGNSRDAALGQAVRLNHSTFRVIGVLDSYGANNDNVIIMPEKVARARVLGNGYHGDELSSIIAKSTSTVAVATTATRITDVLRASHHVHDPRYDDFQVQDIGARLTTFTHLLAMLTGLAPTIASTSMVIGGIGLLNIILVAVAARTREVGIRKALGATKRALITQFGVEAVALATIGGIIGMIGGIGLVLIIKSMIPLFGTTGFFRTFDPELTLTPILGSFFTSLIIGIVSGIYPAWRASRIPPVVALRAE